MRAHHIEPWNGSRLPALSFPEDAMVAKEKNGDFSMLYWALVFLVVALVAGVLGFGGIAGASAGIAQILFYIFLVLLVVSVVSSLMRRAR